MAARSTPLPELVALARKGNATAYAALLVAYRAKLIAYASLHIADNSVIEKHVNATIAYAERRRRAWRRRKILLEEWLLLRLNKKFAATRIPLEFAQVGEYRTVIDAVAPGLSEESVKIILTLNAVMLPRDSVARILNTSIANVTTACKNYAHARAQAGQA